MNSAIRKAYREGNKKSGANRQEIYGPLFFYVLLYINPLPYIPAPTPPKCLEQKQIMFRGDYVFGPIVYLCAGRERGAEVLRLKIIDIRPLGRRNYSCYKIVNHFRERSQNAAFRKEKKMKTFNTRARLGDNCFGHLFCHPEHTGPRYYIQIEFDHHGRQFVPNKNPLFISKQY